MKMMSKEEFNKSYLKLQEDTVKAINELESLTGKEVVFRLIKKEEAATYFKLKIKLARKIMDNHIIVINEDNVDDKYELNYWIVHEIMHGLRIFNADESDRITFKVYNDKIKSLSDKLYLEEKSNFKSVGLDEFRAKQYTEFLVSNIFQLLFNSAVDARIELTIYNNYPSLRELQKKCQKIYVKDILVSYDKKKTALIPKWILLRVNAMNYTYLNTITPIIGTSWKSKANEFKASGFRELINALMVDLEKEDKGQKTDIETLKHWTEVLGVNGFYRMDDFENVDFFYAMTN